MTTLDEYPEAKTVLVAMKELMDANVLQIDYHVIREKTGLDIVTIAEVIDWLEEEGLAAH